MSNIKIDPLITQKADKIRLAMKIATIAAILLVFTAFITSCVAVGIYAAAMIMPFPFIVVIYPFFAASPPAAMALPSAAINLFITSGACTSAGIISAMTSRVLENSSAIREERVQNDRNFQEFVRNYLETDLNIFPKLKDLTDRRLHSIYSQWKNHMLELSRTVIRLRHQSDMMEVRRTWRN